MDGVLCFSIYWLVPIGIIFTIPKTCLVFHEFLSGTRKKLVIEPNRAGWSRIRILS